MIEVRNLRLEIEGRAILENISFSIAAGEAVALVGPNGSGKSSLLRCLLGLMPFEGHAAIAGHDVASAPIESRAKLAYLPQRPSFGEDTAEEVLAFFARLRNVPRARVPELLEETGLAAHACQRARTFSGGMQQRLLLAIALLPDPAVLLLDEPTASLDREGQAAFLAIMARFRRERRTILVSSHRSQEIEALTSRVLVLENGRLVREGAGADLLTDPHVRSAYLGI